MSKIWKYQREWPAYMAGVGFVIASSMLLWALLKEWARLVAR